ncbi:MAG: hypothetical protein OEL75_00670, partial [Kiritimatiellaceae bacterium]|nr:hypothetical protein [Kiritimatiellaceae bacterium]
PKATRAKANTAVKVVFLIFIFMLSNVPEERRAASPSVHLAGSVFSLLLLKMFTRSPNALDAARMMIPQEALIAF